MSTPRHAPTPRPFTAWLDAADPAGAQDVYDLYHAVKDETQAGIWDVAHGHDGLILKAGHVEQRLTIPWDQQAAFLARIEHNDGRGRDMARWDGVQRHLEHPPASPAVPARRMVAAKRVPHRPKVMGRVLARSVLLVPARRAVAMGPLVARRRGASDGQRPTRRDGVSGRRHWWDTTSGAAAASGQPGWHSYREEAFS